MSSEDHEHYDIGQTILGSILNSISILFCLLIIIPYWFRKSIHSFPLDLAILLCLSCCFGHICEISDIFLQHNRYITSILFFFGICGCCLVTILSFTFFINLIYLNFIHNNKKIVSFIYFLIVLGIPLTTSLLVFFNWDRDNIHKSIALIMYLSIIWIFILLNFSILIATIVKISEEIGGKQFQKKLLLYSLAPVIAYIPNTIKMIYGLIAKVEMIGFPSYVPLIFNGLRGIWYTAIYAMNADILSGMNIFKRRKFDSNIENNNTVLKIEGDYSIAVDMTEEL